MHDHIKKISLGTPLIILVGCIMLAGCAGTNSLNRGPAANSALSLCQGIKVSNAPPHDQNKKIKNFHPLQSIRSNIILTLPTQGCLSSAYGPRNQQTGNKTIRFHKGIDIFTKTPRPVVAASDGRIAFIGRKSGYGKVIYINHSNGVSTRYAHLSAFNKTLKKGDKIKQNAPIGLTGKTGNASAIHLHFEILHKDQHINPLRFTS